MSDTSQGPGWWLASDGKWYPPEQAPGTSSSDTTVGAGGADESAAGWASPAGGSTSDEGVGGAGTSPFGSTPPPGPAGAGGWGAPPPYGTPAYGTYGAPYGAMAPQTHSGATTSLVLGIVSLVACGLITGIPAIITGRKARREIAASGGRQTGDGLALTGLILGIVGTVLSAIGIVFFIAVVALGVAASDDINSDPSDGFCNEDRFFQDPDC